jgi:hypothetical protein
VVQSVNSSLRKMVYGVFYVSDMNNQGLIEEEWKLYQQENGLVSLNYHAILSNNLVNCASTSLRRDSSYA